MKISIIIPTYKRPALLAHALRSAAAQTYDPEQYEVVVVNDGGGGINRKSLRALWPGPARLEYCKISHGGLSAAVNRGISIARGEYFTILPDDDMIAATKLSVLGDFLDAHPDALVAYSLPSYVSTDGRPASVPPQLRKFLLAHPVLRWQHILDGHGLWVHGTATMYRKKVVEIAGDWDTKLPTSEEYEWHLRLLASGCDFHAVDAITTVYRKHAGNKSNDYSRRRHEFRDYIRRKLSAL